MIEWIQEEIQKRLHHWVRPHTNKIDQRAQNIS